MLAYGMRSFYALTGTGHGGGDAVSAGEKHPLCFQADVLTMHEIGTFPDILPHATHV